MFQSKHVTNGQLTGANGRRLFRVHREKSYACSSPEAAYIIFTAMEVEKELRENLVTRDMALDGSTIKVTFRATDESSLNSSVYAFGKSFEFAQEIHKELG
jgi:tRNA threonylcarbamoyladenosine modification (KEOPS) complex  Pcc1 subunit